MRSSGTSKRFYGYYIVGATFITLFFCWGMVLNTFPVFVKPLTEDMGWTRGALAVASLTGALTSILLFPIAGKIIDRIGVRPVMIVGAGTIGVSLLAGSQIQHLWQVYVMNAFIGCGLTCATLVPCSYVISNWFVAWRGTAMAITFVGTAVGGMVMAPVANWLIVNYSWRVAFVLAGIEILVLVLPTIYFVIRTRPSDMGLEPYRAPDTEADTAGEAWGVGVKEIFSLRLFWLISAIMLITALVTAGVGFHFVAYLTDLGHSSENATLAWSIVMGVMILGKLAFGPIADRWGAKNAMAAACVVFSISVMILTFAQSYSVALLFAVVYGFALGAPLVLNPLLTGYYLGMRNYGTIFGILNIMGTIGGNAGPIVAGFYFDSRATYLPVFYAFMVLMVLAVVCSLLIKPVAKSLPTTKQPQPADVAG